MRGWSRNAVGTGRAKRHNLVAERIDAIVGSVVSQTGELGKARAVCRIAQKEQQGHLTFLC